MDNVTKLLASVEALHQDENDCDKRITSIDKDISDLRFRYKADLLKISSDRIKFQKEQSRLQLEQEDILKESDTYNQKFRPNS